MMKNTSVAITFTALILSSAAHAGAIGATGSTGPTGAPEAAPVKVETPAAQSQAAPKKPASEASHSTAYLDGVSAGSVNGLPAIGYGATHRMLLATPFGDGTKKLDVMLGGHTDGSAMLGANGQFAAKVDLKGEAGLRKNNLVAALLFARGRADITSNQLAATNVQLGIQPALSRTMGQMTLIAGPYWAAGVGMGADAKGPFPFLPSTTSGKSVELFYGNRLAVTYDKSRTHYFQANESDLLRGIEYVTHKDGSMALTFAVNDRTAPAFKGESEHTMRTYDLGIRLSGKKNPLSVPLIQPVGMQVDKLAAKAGGGQ